MEKREIHSVLTDFLNERLMQVTASGQAAKNDFLKAKIRPVLTKGVLHFQAEEFIGKQAFHKNLTAEEAVDYLKLRESEDFTVTEQEDLKDYLYDGEALRRLSGKKLHKKKNHLNAFLKEYEGRYEYRRLCCSDRGDVWTFLDKWREQKGDDVEDHLDYEVAGIHEILKNCSFLNVRMSGVYIDGQLEAFTIGSYNPLEDMAIIHIEKANPEIRGLYQFINQQFLIHEFPDVKLVNREDDLGQEGLRRAKMSYNPCGFARKYLIEQKNFVPED